MAEKKQVIDIEAPKENELANIAIAGPSRIGENLFSKRSGAVSEGIKFNSASMVRALMQAAQLAGSPKNTVPSFSSPNFTSNLPEVDELAGAKELFKDIAESHNYAEQNYKGENLSSLFKKFAETKDPQDFDRFIDYTTNQVAQQIPQQVVLWGGQAVGVPAPLTLSLLGASSAGQSYLDDKEQAPQLSESQMRQRAAISGASEVASEGLSLGLKGAAMAGKSALEVIPGVKQLMAKGLASSSAKLFQKMSNALGGGPTRRILTNALVNSLGEGGEEVANQAVQIMSDEAYGVRFYTLAEKLDSMIEVFGISAIASGLVGSPMVTAVEIQRAVDTQKFMDIEKQAKPMMENLQERMTSEVNVLPSPEELFTISHIIKRYKNGLPNSRNMDNSIHIVSADVIALEALVDSMIQNKQWNDAQEQSKLGMIGEEIKRQIFDERGFVRMGENKEFFSYLEEVVKTKLPNRATPEQILRTLEGQGVPLEEVQDMGLVEWLKGKDKVTKEELVNYLEGNDIQIQTIQKGEIVNDRARQQAILTATNKRDVASAKLAQKGINIEQDIGGVPGDVLVTDLKTGETIDIDEGTPKDVLGLVDQFSDAEKELDDLESGGPGRPGVKFKNYQLPGGENYREVLLTLPNNNFKSSHFDESGIIAHIRLNDRITPASMQSEGNKASANSFSATAKLLSDAVKTPSFQSEGLSGLDVEEKQAVISGVIGAVRDSEIRRNIIKFVPVDVMNDLVRAKTTPQDFFHNETMLSDSLSSNPDASVKLSVASQRSLISSAANLITKRISASPELAGKSIQGGSAPSTSGFHKEHRTLFIEEIQSDMHQAGRKRGYKTDNDYSDMSKLMAENKVPNAPFKKTWHELALKRILRMAAEEGYDSISWTTGEQQAERYDLSKQLDSIDYDPVPSPQGNIHIIGRKNGEDLFRKWVNEKELDDVVGKEIAKKIRSREGDKLNHNVSEERSWRGLSGIDLKVGGEGMKGFYDQIIPAFLNKYTKKWGGRVGQTKFDLEGREAIISNKDYSTTVHALEITPAMRKGILKGQAVYGSKSTGTEGMARIAKGQDSEGYKKSVEEVKKQKPFTNQPESVKQSYNRGELSKAIGEVQAEIREIISQERDVLEDYAGSFRGGEIIRGEDGAGYRTSLPDMVKHPKTGNKPINNKQWRELAIYNLARGKSVTGEHENYRNLLKQKKEFISRLADIEMQAASDEINVRTQNTSEELKAFTQQEKEWFRETTKQTEVFDDVPPTNLSEIESILGNMEPSELKDIFSGTMYTRDFYRNFEKVFGKNLPAIDKYILKPLDESMLESIKFSERMVNELKSEIVNKLGIKKKSKLSAAVQLYGEGKFDPEEGRYFKLSDEELASMVGKENVEKVKIAEKWFREKYDLLLTRVNAVISKIYPGNKDKIIPKRNNYFRHFSELSEFRGLINIFDNPANISSDLAGTSMFTKPKMKWLSFAQQRLGWRTDIDAVGGFLNYLPAAAHAIYVDPNIPKIRALEKALRVATHDTKNLNNFIEFLMMYANELAGKTGVVDRLPLQLVGRKGIRAIDWVSRRVKSNLILFSLGSAISQAFNLPQAIAKTKVYFVPGTQDYMKSIFTKDGPHKKSIFLPTRYGNDIYFAFNADIMNKPKEAARWIMTALDHVSTHMMWYSFYDQAIGQKMDDPIRYADTETRKMVAGRSTHEVPLLYKSKVMQATAPFTLEMSNLWWALGDDLKDKDFAGLALFAIAAWLMNSGAELIRGYRVIFDPIDMLIQAFSGDKTIPQRVGRVLGEISSNVPFGKQVQGLYPMYGWKVSDGYKMPTREQFFGENDQTRFGNAIVAMSAVTDPIFSFAFPYGGRQVKKTLDAVSVLQKGSVPAGKSEIKFKQTLPTAVKALAFGKGSIPEVREYYKAKNEKKANPTGEDRRKKSKSYGGSYGKSSSKYGGSYGK